MKYRNKSWYKALKHYYQSNYFIVMLYIILPFIFHGIGINIWQIPIAPGDGFIFGLPSKIFSSTLCSWNQYVQCGTYAFKDIGYQSLYLPGMIIMKLFPNPFGYNLLLLFHYAFAGFFTYLYVSTQKLNRFASFISGVVFMFSGFLVAHKGHHSMMNAAIWLPLILYYIELYIHKKNTIYILRRIISLHRK